MRFPTPKKSYSARLVGVWQKRRERGDSCAAIGKDYGLSAHVIRVNTSLERKLVTASDVVRWQDRRDEGESCASIAKSDGFSSEIVRRYTDGPVVPDDAVPLYKVRHVKDFTKEFPITVNGVVVGYFKPKGDDNGL